MTEAEYEARKKAICDEEITAMWDRVATRAAQLFAEKAAYDFVQEFAKEFPEWRSH